MRGRRSFALLVFSALLIHSKFATPADFVGHSEGVGIKLGLTASGVRGSCPPQGDDYQLTIAGSSDPLLGITGGLFWSYAFTPKFSVQTDFQITQGGTDGNLYAGTVPIPDGTVRLRYFELAVLPKMHFRERDRQRYSAYAGMTAGYQFDDDAPSGTTPQVENFQYGLGIGAIWDRDSDRFNTLVDLRYTTSFNDLQPSKSGSSIKNQALTLSVGISSGSRRARGQQESEHTQLEWKLDASPDDRIRVDLTDGSKMEGRLVRYEPSMLTLSHLRPWYSYSKKHPKPDSVSVDSVDVREVGIPMEGVKRLLVRKGEAKKGALIGAAFGAALGALTMVEGKDELGGGVFGGGLAFVCCTVAGAIFGGIDHWVGVYP